LKNYKKLFVITLLVYKIAKLAELPMGLSLVEPKRAKEQLAKCTPNYSNDTWWLQSAETPDRQQTSLFW